MAIHLKHWQKSRLELLCRTDYTKGVRTRLLPTGREINAHSDGSLLELCKPIYIVQDWLDLAGITSR